MLGDIEKSIASSIEFRSKKELIDGFVNKMNGKTNVSEDFDKYVKEQRDKDLEAIIEIHSLKSQETKKFIENALQNAIIKTFGINIDKILSPASLFDNSRQLKNNK